MNVKISVIVPAYNVAQHVENTVKSLQRQSYTNVEIILVDDGSTDGTMDIICRLAREDNRIIAVHQSNAGVTAARLNGVEHASGEYIGFVDSDDFVEPEMYECLLANARKYNADISHCGYRMIVGKRVDFYWNTGKIEEDNRQTAQAKLLRGEIEPGLCNKLFHRALFEHAALRERMPPDIKNNEDLLMNYWLFRLTHKVIFEDVCPYHYIVRSGSATSNPQTFINRLLDPLKVMRIIAGDVAGNLDLEKIVHSRILCSLANLSTISAETVSQKEIRQNARNELKKEYAHFYSFLTDRKQKIRVVLARFTPWLCHLVFELYSHLSGNAKRYVVTDDKGANQ